MRCVICKQGETMPSKTSVTLQRGGATIVIRTVPALICQNCGEVYLEEEVSRELLLQGEKAEQAGVLVEIREFQSAEML